ncbi:MAG: phosphomannomutase, partial [Pseudomonadota bacterium]
GAFVARYLDSFPPHCLRGLRVAVYEHSSVARESLAEVLAGLGAEVVCLGRSGHFVPVDTEAIRPEDQALARAWAKRVGFDAIVSADGDGDRPLLGDERGEWWRGDLIGPWCARFLGIRTLVTPVSSNTLVEKSGWFEQVIRTRIGSPYVIEAMVQAEREGRGPVAGYEANGGFLTASPIPLARGILGALPTRDCLLPILAVLCDARASGRPLSALTQGLPQRFTHSGRLQDFPATISQARLAAWCPTDLSVVSQMAACERLEDFFGAVLGAVHTLDLTDGLRITFASGDILHLRPSGNAPELRVYVEASSPGAAEAMTASSLALLEGWRRA